MKLLQKNVLEGDQLKCFEATQVLGGSTRILIWGVGGGGGSEIAKSPTR